MQKIVLLSGPVATGKTTLVKQLATYFNKSAYIDTDMFKWFIQNGLVREIEVENGTATMEECLLQHNIAIKCTGDTATRFYEEGYNVFIADLVYMDSFEELYDHFFLKFKDAQIYKILLSETYEKMIERSGILKPGMTPVLYKKYLQWFDAKNKDGWKQIDTSNISLTEVFNEILKIIV